MIRRKLAQLLKKAAGLPAQAGKHADFDLSLAAKSEFGHYSTNLALRLAKEKGRSPMAVAEEIAERVRKVAPQRFIQNVQVAPPGFINFWLSEKAIQEEFAQIAASRDYGRLDLLKGKKVMVEYTDPNPFKQFHIGHLMTNVIGEAIARLHEAAGAKVLRVNYQGDVGLHVAKTIWGILYILQGSLPRKGDALDKKIRYLANAYTVGSGAYDMKDISGSLRGGPDKDELRKQVEDINVKVYNRSDKEINRLYDLGRKWSLDYFETIYRRLGTKFVHYFFESEVGPVGVKLVKAHPEVFQKSEGAIIFPGEKYGLHNRVFINSQGLPTYEAKELGLNQKKFDLYHPDASFIVTGNEINEYFRVVLKAMEQVVPEAAEKTVHLSHGMMRLPSGKMSSRTGEVITAEALIDQLKEAVAKKVAERKELTKREREEIEEKVALAAIRYSILKQGVGRDIVFDMDKSISFQGDSGPYLQYTYARLRSILRKSRGVERGTWNAARLIEENELALIRKMAEFPEAVKSAAAACAPNAVAVYLYELANAINSYYESTPILKDEDKERREARLALVAVAAGVMKTGLGLLGISAPEKI